jgi:putative intracellular protease/amidase
LLDDQYAYDYDAVYLPGGHAPLFDLVDHRHLKQLLIDFDTQMKPIVAICHGVVGLVNVRRTNEGNALIHGRILTGFSLEEDLSSGNDDEDLVTRNPFILETKLKEQGAIYMKVSPGKEYIVQDGLLLTGQNPASARQLAYRFGELIDQCAAQDYQQINLTSSLPKTLITCHVALTNNNPHLLSRLKLAHLEYIQRHQHLIVFSGSTLFVEPSHMTQQDSSAMVILLATNDLRQAQHFIEHEPYTASKQIFDVTQIKPFKQLFPSANNQQLLNYHIQQELFKSHH